MTAQCCDDGEPPDPPDQDRLVCHHDGHGL